MSRLVLATAGHVDHGKSTLLRALTGMEPDRWLEERRRGMTLDLGFVWCDLPDGHELTAVDVPGHERFVPTMLAGVGPVPAVLLVVAADEGWMPQTAEHVAAALAFGVEHGVVAVTRCDLADPAAVIAEVGALLAGTPLAALPRVAVSGRTGQGVDALRQALAGLAGALPAPDPDAPVRLWVDRSFTIRGAGTVVTGTLSAGTVRVGDVLQVDGERVRVRSVQSQDTPREAVTGPARVALNLRDVDPAAVPRGSALTTPGAWLSSSLLDVAVPGGGAGALPRRPLLHAGSTAVSAGVRRLADDVVRLRLDAALPLRVGDRVLLRDPGSRAVVGATVLDPLPPPLARRGAARARAGVLRSGRGADVVTRGVARLADLAAIGRPAPPGAPSLRGWVLDPGAVDRLAGGLAEAVAEHRRRRPLDPGPTQSDVARRLGLPDPILLRLLVRPPLGLRDGRVVDADTAPTVPPELAEPLRRLAEHLEGSPFAAPDAGALRELGLTPPRVAAAARLGLVCVPADGVVLGPDAAARAVEVLAAVPVGFTVSEAARALQTSRRVAVPLLELLDRLGATRRDVAGRRVLVPGAPDPPSAS